MAPKSRVQLHWSKGEIKEKIEKKRFSKIRTWLQNIRTSGGKIKMPISAEETTSFRGGLIILFLLGIEEAIWMKKKNMMVSVRSIEHHQIQAHYRTNGLPQIPKLIHSPSPPWCAFDIKETHRQQSNNDRTIGVLILPKHGATSIYTRSRSPEDKDQISLEVWLYKSQ